MNMVWGKKKQKSVGETEKVQEILERISGGINEMVLPPNIPN